MALTLSREGSRLFIYRYILMDGFRLLNTVMQQQIMIKHQYSISRRQTHIQHKMLDISGGSF